MFYPELFRSWNNRIPYLNSPSEHLEVEAQTGEKGPVAGQNASEI